MLPCETHYNYSHSWMRNRASKMANVSRYYNRVRDNNHEVMNKQQLTNEQFSALIRTLNNLEIPYEDWGIVEFTWLVDGGDWYGSQPDGKTIEPGTYIYIYTNRNQVALITSSCPFYCYRNNEAVWPPRKSIVLVYRLM